LPPVSAQNRKEIPVQLLTVNANNDFYLRTVTPSALAVDPLPWRNTSVFQAQGYTICALGNLKADFGIRD
jgi:hypothetical protein